LNRYTEEEELDQSHKSAIYHQDAISVHCIVKRARMRININIFTS